MKPINVYNLGEEGVNVDVDEVHLRDGELRSAQNFQIDPAGGIGGIRRRDGIAAFSSGISGSLTGMIGLPLPDRSQLTTRFYSPLDDDDAGRWRTSTDGITWSDTGANGLEYARMTSDFAALGAGTLDLFLAAANGVLAHNNKMYYFGSDYTQGTTLPTIHVWDGTNDYQISEIPINPAIPGDIPETGGFIYPYDDSTLIVSSWDGTTQARVFTMDVTTGAMTQLGPETAIASTPGGFPMSVAVYQGSIYIGICNTSGASATQILRTRPGDATWETDFTTPTTNGYVVGLQVFKGKLYAGLAADVLSAALLKERTSDGTWSTVQTSVGTDPGTNYGPFILSADGGTIYAFFGTVSGPGAELAASIIKSTDGSSWSLEYDIETNHTSAYASTGFPYRDASGNIYWPIKTAGAAKILKRAASNGAWSTVDTDNHFGNLTSIKF